MQLCDLHCHSSGISRCCKITYEKVIETAKEAGFNSLVLTNHYAKEYLKDISSDDFIDKYYLEYENAKEYGKKLGIKIFFGVEVTMEFNRKIHLLIYGITVKLLKENPYLFDLSLEEISKFCRENNLFLAQAHPFRGGTNVLNPIYFDAVEINCHPLYGNTYSKELTMIAKANNLVLTCGCDYHGDVDYRPKGGMFIPDNIDSEDDLTLYLKNTKTFNLQINEINDNNLKNIIYELK